MFENKETTSLENLGEFGLIKHLSAHIKLQNINTQLGIGDDAAVISSHGKMVVVSTDMLLENVHFDMMYTPLKHLGYKAAIVNLSDVLAMNAIPTQLTISIALSSKYTLEAIEELYSGIMLACQKYKVDLVGGDTSSSHKGLVISGTAIGFADENEIVKRSGAKAGDLLCVTGDLGGAYMGLQLLEREKRVFLEHKDMQPDLKNHDYIVGRQLKPEARLDIINQLKELNIKPTSMIDISDGLASEIFHLSEQSKVDFSIYEDKLPIDQDTYNMAVDFGIDPTTAALNGGEDYELLFTVSQSEHDKIKNNPDISIIGYAKEVGMKNQLISKQGNVYDLKAQGWQHL
ncbi:MAG: thiamine-phosphate kinase [Flavobacteriales bacterium]|nr:thiamine-phosphate kinase [Flavobacteriales bacterium]